MEKSNFKRRSQSSSGEVHFHTEKSELHHWHDRLPLTLCWAQGKGKGKEGGTRQKQPLFKMGPVEDTFTTERRVAGRAQKTEDSETKAQPLFKIGPVEDAFTTERRAAGRAQKMEYPETKAQPLFKMGPVEDTFTTERRAAGRAQKMEGPETKAGSSASDHGCRGEAAPQPKWRSQYDLESQDSDGATPSPRSTLYRLESPPLSPSWGLPETSQQSPPPCTADCQQDEAAGDLPNRPPPIHTALLTPKTSPYSAELRTGYAPFFPEAVEARSNGLGERCSSYTALHTLAGSPKKGMRRSKSSIDCTCLPPRPRPGVRPSSYAPRGCLPCFKCPFSPLPSDAVRELPCGMIGDAAHSGSISCRM